MKRMGVKGRGHKKRCVMMVRCMKKIEGKEEDIRKGDVNDEGEECEEDKNQRKRVKVRKIKRRKKKVIMKIGRRERGYNKGMYEC